MIEIKKLSRKQKMKKEKGRGFFFFKQKTAYEMRISDWSSDVCSSDLHVRHQDSARHLPHQEGRRSQVRLEGARQDFGRNDRPLEACRNRAEIGRASCRERVCQYV